MRGYVLKRILLVIPQIVVVAVGTFVLLRVLPADPVARIVGLDASKSSYNAERATLGLSKPLAAQTLDYLDGVIHGNLGNSWQSGDSVRADIGAHLPITLQLVVLALIVALAIGIPVGRMLAVRSGRRIDRVMHVYSLFAGSQPDFWWGLIFIYVFFFRLHILPAPLGLLSLSATPPQPITGFILVDSLLRGDFSTFGDAVSHFTLPVLTLAFILTGPIIRMTREGVRAVADADYILYARAAGLSRRTVSWYMLRNGLAPVLTLVGVFFGILLGGVVLIETVFSLNGIGVYALQSVLNLDYPAVEGCVVVLTLVSLLVYILMDILYAVLDPRVRYS